MPGEKTIFTGTVGEVQREGLNARDTVGNIAVDRFSDRDFAAGVR